MIKFGSPSRCAPDDQRCEATCKPNPCGQGWQKVEHSCIERAKQMRGIPNGGVYPVCKRHYNAPDFKPWKEPS